MFCIFTHGRIASKQLPRWSTPVGLMPERTNCECWNMNQVLFHQLLQSLIEVVHVTSRLNGVRIKSEHIVNLQKQLLQSGCFQLPQNNIQKMEMIRNQEQLSHITDAISVFLTLIEAKFVGEKREAIPPILTEEIKYQRSISHIQAPQQVFLNLSVDILVETKIQKDTKTTKLQCFKH